MKITDKKIKFTHGFSLIEIIIYLAMFTVVSILVINSFIVILSSFNTTNMNRRLLESGSVAMERISREIRKSENIDSNSTSDTLILYGSDDLGNPVIVKFIKENGELNLYKNNNSEKEGNLLGSNVNITSLVFRNIFTAQGQGVKIEMTLQYQDSRNTKTENFYNTIVLRGRY